MLVRYCKCVYGVSMSEKPFIDVKRSPPFCSVTVAVYSFGTVNQRLLITLLVCTLFCLQYSPPGRLIEG